MQAHLEERVTPPNVSEQTLKEMAAFFMKTSIPRILKEKQIKEEPN